ncbi:MAG: metalloregulator ArsR/SmtB family transcription factor, partial [Alphaproteobacteria bacterium]
LVWHDEMTAGDIAAHFDVSRPAVSQHLAILRDAELVAVRPLGTRRFYRARPETIAAVRDYLDAFWDNSLERLKRAVEGTAHGNG